MMKLITTTTPQIYLGLLILVLSAVFGMSVSAQSNDYNVTLSETTISAGESITIQWTAPADAATQQDWIGLYEVGSSNRVFLDWKYISTSQRSLSFTIDTPGRYEFRYLKNNGYEHVASSPVLRVESYQKPITLPPTSGNNYELTISSNSYEVDELIHVAWTAPAGVDMRQDWIGLYRVGSNNRTYVDWTYLNQAGTNGTVSFQVDAPGTYEFRYLKNNLYEQVAQSNQFTVSAGTSQPPNNPPAADGNYTLAIQSGSYKIHDTVIVSWSAPADRPVRQGWIGVYAANASDQQFKSWQYINQASNSGVINFTLKNTGTYELRFFTGNNYDRVATSRPFVVTNVSDPIDDDDDSEEEQPSSGYELMVNTQTITTGQSVSVSWTAASNDNRQRDWIGLYRANATNRSFLDWTYVQAVAGSANFTINAPGTYEFRYLKNDGYVSVATSPRVQVLPEADGNPTPSPAQCAVTDLSRVTNYPPRGGPIIALGDSLTEGVGAASNQDYVSQLEDLVGVPIRNEGVSGDTTEEALARLESSVLASNPATVIVWLGGNDILGRYYARVQSGLENASVGERLELLVLQLSGKIPDTTNISEAQTFTNLETIVNRIHGNGAVVILVGFSGGVFDDDLDLLYQGVASATGAIYVPDIMSGIIGRPSLMSDVVHPNGAGYALVAERIAPYLRCVL